MELIQKGNDPRGLLMAAGAAAGAVVAVLLPLLTDFTLAIGRLALPQWSWYVVALGLVGVAGVTLFMSMGVERCATCKAPLVNHEAYFDLEHAPLVVWAVEHLDPMPLEPLQPVPKNQMKAVASVSYCEKCRAVGTLQASKWQDHQPHDLTPERTVSGPAVARFAALVDKHVAFRGDDE
jgi:hypothetical protein